MLRCSRVLGPDRPSAGVGPKASDAPLELAELARLVREHRGTMSVRQAAQDAGVSFSTLGRVEAGMQPDLATFLRLCAWLGVEPERLIRPTARRRASAVDHVAKHLLADPNLSSEAANRIVGVVRDMYRALAAPQPVGDPIAVHLRAATVMRPGVPERLGDLLRDMRSALE